MIRVSTPQRAAREQLKRAGYDCPHCKAQIVFGDSICKVTKEQHAAPTCKQCENPMLKGIHTCSRANTGYVSYSRLTDAELESEYSLGRFEELIRRYKEKKAALSATESLMKQKEKECEKLKLEVHLLLNPEGTAKKNYRFSSQT